MKFKELINLYESEKKLADYFSRGYINDSLGHAYHLYGSNFFNQLRMVKFVSMLINCSEDSSPCFVCLQCKRINRNQHSDVLMLGISSESKALTKTITIQEIRDAIKWIHINPYEGKFKVLVIIQAENMTIEASNSFLKILEDPPPFALFFLITQSEFGLSDTVSSRCISLKGSKSTAQEINDFLKDLPIETHLKLKYSRLCNGSISLLETWLDDPKIFQTYLSLINEGIQLFLIPMVEKFEYINQLLKKGKNNKYYYLEIFDIWIMIWRDIISFNMEAGYESKLLEDFSDLEKLKHKFSEEQLLEIGSLMTKFRIAIEENANPELVLNNLILSMKN